MLLPVPLPEVSNSSLDRTKRAAKKEYKLLVESLLQQNKREPDKLEQQGTNIMSFIV